MVWRCRNPLEQRRHQVSNAVANGHIVSSKQTRSARWSNDPALRQAHTAKFGTRPAEDPSYDCSVRRYACTSTILPPFSTMPAQDEDVAPRFIQRQCCIGVPTPSISRYRIFAMAIASSGLALQRRRTRERQGHQQIRRIRHGVHVAKLHMPQ